MAPQTRIAVSLTICVTTALLAALVVDEPLEGREAAASRAVPAVEAAFELESYRPGARARLTVDDRYRMLELQVFRSGPERVRTRRDTDLQGVPVTHERTIAGGVGRRVLTVPIGDWKSGLHFARLSAPDGRIGFAPFVVAPRRLGENDVAVVLPTLTWQAYNFRDEDGDGTGDSWYVDPSRSTVRLGRSHLSRGVPYGLRYHLGFLRWLEWTGKEVDYLSQWDLERAGSAAALARAYDLVVFAGHHEYVTEREYDLVEGYRDLGGNLLFLSANNFFWRVDLKDRKLWRIKKWRDLGRPEARLIGVQYRANDDGSRAAPYTIVNRNAAPWLFAGLETADGSPLGEARYGIEFDMVTPDSPAGTTVLAEVNPGLADPTIRGQMTYYETPAGARVFAPGTLSFGGSDNPTGERLFTNIWDQLTRP